MMDKSIKVAYMVEAFRERRLFVLVGREGRKGGE